MNRHLKFFLTLSLILKWQSLLACITAPVLTIPAKKNISIGKTAQFGLTWQLNSKISTTITSSFGTLSYGQNSLNINTVLSKTTTKAGSTLILETIKIPSHIIYDAYRNGIRTLTYQRNFSPSCTPPSATLSGQAEFIISGSGSAGFAINQVSIRFDNNLTKRIIKRNEKLPIYARINYSGTGLLKAVWEIAEPSSSLGEINFRQLKLIRKQLAGSGLIKIQGPRLPANQDGMHLIRLRISNPAVDFSPPVIRYFVTNKKQDLNIKTTIPLLSPEHETQFNKDTYFAWTTITNAAAYQLEFYLDQSTSKQYALPSLGTSQPSKLESKQVFAAGIIVDANKTQTTIPQNIRSKLKNNKWYMWRLIALNKQGKIIAQSQMRLIFNP